MERLSHNLHHYQNYFFLRDPCWQGLDPTMTNRRLRQRTSLPTNDTNCRVSFFSPIPHGGWDLGLAGPIQWICREWAKRLGLGERTVISYGVHDDRTEVNWAYPRRLSPRHGLGGSGSWTWSQSPFWTASSSFYTSFFPSLLSGTSTSRFSFIGLILVLLVHTQSGWRLL